MVEIHLQKVVDDSEGIFVGCGIKIKGAAEEMAGGIGQEKLLSGGCIAADMEKDATDPVGSMNQGLVDRAGFNRMLVGHLKCIVDQFVEFVAGLMRVAGRRADPLVADINPCVEAGKVYIDPVGVLGNGIEEAAVFDHIGIHGVFEAIWVAGAVERLILMRREIDPEIPSSFWRIGAITGLERSQCED